MQEKSKTARDEPNRVSPYTDIELPTRINVRSDSEDAKLAKSSRESDEPRRDRP